MIENLIALSPYKEEKLSSKEQEKIQEVAAFYTQKLGLSSDLDIYQSLILQKLPENRSALLNIENFSSVDLLGRHKGLESYFSRALLRSRHEDIVIGLFSSMAGYLKYMSERLQLGTPHYIHFPPLKTDLHEPPFALLLKDKETQQQIISCLRGRELVIQPFMASKDAWDFAKSLQEEFKVDPNVKVLGPLPLLSKSVNNKIIFLSMMKMLLGEDASINFASSFYLSEIVEHIKRKVEIYGKVLLRFPNSATGCASILINQSLIEEEPDFFGYIQSWLEKYDWKEGEQELMVTGWELDVVASPSAQTWIFPEKTKSPMIEKIVNQKFSLENSLLFSGCSFPNFNCEVSREIYRKSLIACSFLQQMGYSGRCSFDFVVLQKNGKTSVKFVECNGRWGGGSSPLVLMNRLFKGEEEKYYTVDSISDILLAKVSFLEFLEKFDDILYDARTKKGWAVVYKPSWEEGERSFELLTIGDSTKEATDRLALFKEMFAQRLK